MFKYFFFLFFFIFIANTNANNKTQIIENLEKTKNLSFKFEQNINGKIENGNCIIEYPKKIFCKYLKNNDKVLVSNGKSLVIKTKTSFYRYPLQKTPLDLILDKNYLIKKINDLNAKIIDQAFINYTIIENNNEINIFFNNKTFDLMGWQTKDIYQNLSITLISAIQINQKISNNVFRLPSQN
ncbi:outer-membrane lipoprotein carrier protein LolA [Candidatus Pelagibacter sp.]|nr:outer-membrane lipoprotein carrier protein LolA [Candidatus Pelagibacter sp.]